MSFPGCFPGMYINCHILIPYLVCAHIMDFVHRRIGESLMEDICKPLRNMCDNHSKVKKPVSKR